MKLKDKVILVTGSGSGMGRELTLNLLSKGANVMGVDINETALNETVELAGNRKEHLATIVTDITDKQSIEILLEKSISAFGGVDGIINNAGIIQPFSKLNELDFEKIERVFKINFYGTLYIIKIFLPHLLTRPEAHIVNISSMGGFLPVPGQIIYGASKAAVKLLTEGLTSELTDTNVNISVVFPGAIRTNIKVNSGLGAEAGATPENSKNGGVALSPAIAAQIIVAGIEGNKKRIFVGKDSKMMNLLYKLNPDFASNLIAKKIKHKL